VTRTQCQGVGHPKTKGPAQHAGPLILDGGS
jgi:hypothetical protein